ncbi:hypothetical protein Tco_1369862 [Tanacetum coccineum]
MIVFWGSLIFVLESDEYQVYRALLPEGMTNQQIRDSPTYKTYLAFVTGATTPKKAWKFKKSASPSKKKALVVVFEPAEKLVKKSAARRQSAAASLKEAQLKKAIKRSKRETNIHQAGGSSEGADLVSEVPDEPKGKSIDINSDDDDDDDDDDQQSGDERTESDDKKNMMNINKEMYDDVNVELKDAEHANEEKGDEEMTHAENVNVEHEEFVRSLVSKATISTTYAPDSSTLTAFHKRLSDLENEVKTLRNVDHSSTIRAVIKSEVPTFFKEYLGTNLDDTLHKVTHRHTTELIKEDFVPANVMEVLQQQQKPHKSAIDIHKIKMEHVAKQQES